MTARQMEVEGQQLPWNLTEPAANRYQPQAYGVQLHARIPACTNAQRSVSSNH